MPSDKLEEKFPNVSVIILTHNGNKYIDALLRSLLDQSYPSEKVELIVVDNASTDNTLSLVQTNFPTVRLVALDKNVGFAAGNNQAQQQAQNDFLVFLNQDTLCHQDWLRGLVSGIIEDVEIGACTSNMVLPEASEFRYMDRYSPLDSLYFYDLSPFGYGQYRKITGRVSVFPKILSGCSFVIRREIVAELGYLFDEQLWMYVEDTELSLRIHNLGKRICARRDSIVYHLHGGDARINLAQFYVAAKAVMNRVYAFFKNMGALEFSLFFPILFFGGVFKIFEFSLSTPKKTFYFLPFALFSMACMLLALFGLPKFTSKRRLVLKNRRVNKFPILKLLLRQKP